jgi:hypothetical protein
VAAIPAQLAADLLPAVPPVLPHLFQLGTSVPELARAGLSAVLRWLDCLPPAKELQIFESCGTLIFVFLHFVA